jgi:hypothetical protein
MPWYEWVFSGAGAAALTVAATIYLARRGKGANKATSTEIHGDHNKTESIVQPILSGTINNSQLAFGNNVSQVGEMHTHVYPSVPSLRVPFAERISTHPNPAEIKAEFSKLNAFQKHEAETREWDVEASWPVSLAGVEKDKLSGEYILYFTYANEPVPVVVFARFREIPNIVKLAPDSARWWITGRIQRYNGISVWLYENPELDLEWPKNKRKER